MDLYYQQQSAAGEQQQYPHYGWPPHPLYQPPPHYAPNTNTHKNTSKHARQKTNIPPNGSLQDRPPTLRPIGVNKAVYFQQQVVQPKHEQYIDLTKLKVASLRRYVKYFDLDNVASNTPKNQLVKIIQEHWKKLKFDEALEKQTILDFTRKYKQEKLQVKGSRRLRQQVARRDFIDDEDYEI
eukprot:TRINITY_DN4072_c0_g1_i1.p2 TRINITY_DN4072_c0_g1~~TRINITY_DN4072_c0_g1_i1.p2  ORF type:complete len:182 (-),score=16.28 TRINITY_DN4072_c0_g1_i1:465-1010(-)